MRTYRIALLNDRIRSCLIKRNMLISMNQRFENGGGIRNCLCFILSWVAKLNKKFYFGWQKGDFGWHNVKILATRLHPNYHFPRY